VESCNTVVLIAHNSLPFSYFLHPKIRNFSYFFYSPQFGQWPTISDGNFNAAIVLPTFSSTNWCP
jgi:hypothetical protein